MKTKNIFAAFLVIGQSLILFSGNYDGCGYTISNLHIDRSEDMVLVKIS